MVSELLKRQAFAFLVLRPFKFLEQLLDFIVLLLQQFRGIHWD